MEDAGEFFSGRRPRRDRSREGIGKSEKSYIKHNIIRRAVGGQIGAFRYKNPCRIAIIDGNAGDGQGVELPQFDMFNPNVSTTTAELAESIAADVGDAVVILCEKDKHRRASLRQKFSDAIILNDNSHARDAIPRDCGYAIWISDPCGPAGHGVEAMKAVASSMRSDFVVVMNEGAVKRIAGTSDELWQKSRELYVPMIESECFWSDALGRSHLTRTPLIDGAKNFKYRIFVAANVLSDASRRRPFEVIR